MTDENITYDPYVPRQTEAVKADAQVKNEDERAQYEEQVFIRVFNSVKTGKSNIGEEMAEINEAYKRLKPVGFTKADIKWAFELEEKDSNEVIATMQRRIRIAKILGHGLARQVELFDTDRAPIEERAYEEGLAAGKLRKGIGANPYDITSPAGQAWARGEADGNAFANKDLASLFEGDAGKDELISGADPFEDAA
ncbi:hypothetical protein [Pseudaminobacter salicylatoxidans]|uniref:hypothetical protein n=1 Tax=Pseudaminobacter salicylatoxidans TaxID=93369 RepID=UPI000300B5CE|nr:hypothetical protein [Pseudaminobacter salicylatoxidans]